MTFLSIVTYLLIFKSCILGEIIIKLLFHIHEIHEKLNYTARKNNCLLGLRGHISEQKDHVVNMNILNMATNMIEKTNYGTLTRYNNIRHRSCIMK